MGTRTGKPKGRPKGSANKASVARAEEVEASGLTPLEFMLDAMRDVGQPINIRLDAAKAAAQYVHPKLSAVTLKGDPDSPLQSVEMTRKEFEEAARELLSEV
jgi:hypothetical protein